MQETVISFEEVMQTKLKVKLCIFQPLGNPCILQKRVFFQAKVFFENMHIYIEKNFLVTNVMLSTGEQTGKRVALFLIPRILTE